MNVFDLRSKLVEDYATYIKGFLRIRDPRINGHVTNEMAAGRLWPKPLIQLNPCFLPGATVDGLVAEQLLHGECSRIFRRKHDDGTSQPLRLHTHQEAAIRRGVEGKSYVLTTGTGSGSLKFGIPVLYTSRRRSLATEKEASWLFKHFSYWWLEQNGHDRTLIDSDGL